jgi:hypothetical protein
LEVGNSQVPIPEPNPRMAQNKKRWDRMRTRTPMSTIRTSVFEECMRCARRGGEAKLDHLQNIGPRSACRCAACPDPRRHSSQRQKNNTQQAIQLAGGSNQVGAQFSAPKVALQSMSIHWLCQYALLLLLQVRHSQRHEGSGQEHKAS